MTLKQKITTMDYVAYACSAIVYILPQYLLSSFLSAYYTDVALISAGAVGSIILAMRFTDGISDLLMGTIIDHTHSKLGKARPWLLVGTIGLTITLIFIFHVPSQLSSGGKIIWLAVTYFLIMTVFGTVQGVSSNAMVIYLTNDSQERNKFGASNMAGVYLGGLVATTVTAILLSALGYTQDGYSKTMFIYAAFVLVFGLFSFAKLKERTTGNSSKKENQAKLKEIIFSMFHNKFYLNVVAAGLLINLINGITTGMGIYFCRDIFGNSSLYAVVTLALLLPTLLGLPLAVMIAKKWGHHRTLFYGRIGYMAGVVVQAIGLLSGNLVIYLIAVAFCGLCGATFAACFTARVANICDYNEYKFNVDGAGTLMSATSFCNKIGLGLGSAVTGLILELAHYNGAAASAGTLQSAYTIQIERYAVAFVPIVLNIIVTICIYFSNVDPYMEDVVNSLEEKRNNG